MSLVLKGNMHVTRILYKIVLYSKSGKAKIIYSRYSILPKEISIYNV